MVCSSLTQYTDTFGIFFLVISTDINAQQQLPPLAHEGIYNNCFISVIHVLSRYIN